MFPNQMCTLADFQEFHRWLDTEKGFRDDLRSSMINLTGEVGEVAQVIKKILWQEKLLEAESAEALPVAVSKYRADLGDELADCLAFILKLANHADIDLEDAYRKKMERNLRRTWTAPDVPTEPQE